MTYVWETEYLPQTTRGGEWKEQWHLKKVWDKDPLEKQFDVPLRGTWKVSVAWVTKIGERKWDAQFINHNGNRTFRSLKAAKAYALAIVTLES